MEALYLNIRTGNYFTFTREGKINGNDYEMPDLRLTVSSCRPVERDSNNYLWVTYYSSRVAYLENGWLLVSDTHKDMFRAVAPQPVFRNYVSANFLPLRDYIIEPLGGTRIPEPDETLAIIPQRISVELVG